MIVGTVKPQRKIIMKPTLHSFTTGLVGCLLMLALTATLLLLTIAASFGAPPHPPRPVPPPPPRNGPTPPPPVGVQLLQEFRTIGGGGNNLLHPELNAIPGAPELAIAPLNFIPGTIGNSNAPVDAPNARVISNVIAGGTGANGANADSTDPVSSAWMYVFGQFVDHDLSLEETLPTAPSIDITILAGDPLFISGTTIPMNRTTRSPVTNTIINTVAGYLDLSQLYGVTASQAASLRNADGTLVTSYNGKALPIVDGFFVTGDPRVMENPELTAVTILFMREHNYWVATLKAQHSDWTGDQLYNMAKAITTAEYQNIIYTEYLPVLLGPAAVGPYRGYDPNARAQVTQEFSTAAFRMGHSQVSEEQAGIDNNGNEVFSQTLLDAFFNTPDMDVTNGIDPLLRNLGAEYSQAMDVYTVSTLRNLLFAGLVGGDVDEIDLISIDIQRQRDVGLGSLNQTRRALGLRPYISFAQLTRDTTLQANLATVYSRIDNVDLFIGGSAEEHLPGSEVGQTFQAIIANQFLATRAGDRFFWLNQHFDPQTAALISNTTLTTLMKRNTDTTATLQPNLFIQALLNATPAAPVRPPPPPRLN